MSVVLKTGGHLPQICPGTARLLRASRPSEHSSGEGIPFHIEGLRQADEAIPEPRAVVDSEETA